MPSTLSPSARNNAPGNDSQQSAMGRGGFLIAVFIGGWRTSSITVVDQTCNATTDPADWLDKTFFQIEKPNAIEVIYNGTDSTNSWKLTKASDMADWGDGGLPEGKELDAMLPHLPSTIRPLMIWPMTPRKRRSIKTPRKSSQHQRRL